MRRADRLFRIVQCMRGGRLVTARGPAERLEVTPRTIYRDVADLMASGVPIEGEAGVGYVLREGHHLPPLMFTASEVTALVAGARLLRAWGGAEMAASAEEALVKIEAVLPEKARAQAARVSVHAFGLPEMSPRVRELIDVLETATEARQRLNLDYADAGGLASRRVVRPLGLWFWGKVWTLVAWCELRSDFRMFRLDRIREVVPGERFREEKGRTMRDFLRAEACEEAVTDRGPETGEP
ncbi:helix-turn-helix transcriptional regulator [Histidinibacterium lentulum]|uniref:YafY family transcriptional regulator n=1 Tax=Histidinibacterium lentulum TaxID=2480588 RepID=A0A3N2R143_9RHOB|nr:YafY family protein [Histidinibacterium lentulum]ROU01048.1 YafY family transcriptional regulator [Histidinibacterium lentulum]